MKYVHDRLTDLIEQVLLKKMNSKEPIVIKCANKKEAMCLRIAIYKHAKRLRVDADAKGYSNDLVVSASNLLIRLKNDVELHVLDRSSVIGVSALESALGGFRVTEKESNEELNLLKQWQSENVEVLEVEDNDVKLANLGINNSKLDEEKLNLSNPYYSKD